MCIRKMYNFIKTYTETCMQKQVSYYIIKRAL